VNAQPIDTRHALEALHAIDAGCSREEWHRIGTAAIAAGLTVDDIIAWSESAPNFAGERDVRAAFRTITPKGGIGAGTLWRAAMAAGWRPPGREHSGGRGADAGRAEQPHQKATTGQRGASAGEVWRRCLPADESHPYIEAKQGRAEGLRVVPAGDGLRIAGQSVAGWLVVPVRPLGGSGDEPASLQFVPAPGQGKKLNLPGARMDGVFVVGNLEPGGTAYLCEGIATAWACWRATGRAAVCCFGWGNVARVAAELRRRDAEARLVLVPDSAKERDAERIAREAGALVAAMPEGSPQNFDANDFAQAEGFDALEALLDAAQAPELRFRLLGANELRQLPPLAWRVRGVLPAQGLASVYGPSTSGKSFLLLDMAAAIAEGREWFGYRTKRAPVVFVALEGEAGFRLRVAAWEQAKGRPLPAGLRLVLQDFRLTKDGDVPDLAAAVRSAGAGAVVAIDTLNRAAPEADENASADMGRIIESAKELQRATGGLVVLVHHSGKDATRGLRGHSSLLAALDAAVEVVREGSRREWKVAKAKDGQDGAAHAFRLDVVPLGVDEEGEPVSSCVVARDVMPQEATRSRLPRGGHQKVVFDALGELLAKEGRFGAGCAPSTRRCVQLERAVEALAPRLACEPKRQKERVRQALTGLIASGVVVCREGWLWVA